jgi:HEAT repeat protein
VKRWELVLGIRSGERHLVLATAALFALIQSTHALSANSADALFFLRFGVEKLPSMIVISGVAVMVALLVHAGGLGRYGAQAWLPWITAASGLVALAEWGLSFVDVAVVYSVIWVATQVVILVTFTAIWNAAASVTTTRQAKRLYPIFASAGVAGAIIGNLVTGPLASSLGTENLFALQGVILLGSSILFASLARLFKVDKELGIGSVHQESLSAFRTIWASKLFRLIASFVFIASALFYLIVFPFNEVVTSTFDSEAEIAGFLGLFASVATGVTFLVSLFLANKLFDRLGIVVSLLAIPIVYVVGFGIWLGSFNLATASIVRAAQWVVVYAIAGSATKAMFNVLSGRRRGQVMAFITAVPAQLGIIIGGLTLMVTSGLEDRVTFLFGLVLGLVAALIVIRTRMAYSDAVIAAIKKGLVGVFRVPHEGVTSPFGREAIEHLTEYLQGPTPEERRMGLLGLAETGDQAHGDAVEPLLLDPDSRVRVAALESMCALDSNRAPVFVAAALGDESAHVRARAIGMIGRADSDLVAALVDDPDPVVKALAAVAVGGDSGQRTFDDLLSNDDSLSILAVLDSGFEDGDLDLDTKRFLRHPDPDIRAAVVLTSAGKLDPADLRPGLDDESIRVRRVSAETLAGSEEGRTLLLEVVEIGSVSATDAALRCLVPVDRFTDRFLGWAQREAARARLLTDYRIALESEESSPKGQYLSVVLRQRAERLEDWVLLAMTTSETKDMMSIVERGLAADDPDTKAQAIEALDVGGPRVITKPLIDLLEAQSGASALSQDQALAKMSDDFDPWISALAARAAEDKHAASAFLADSSVVRPYSNQPLNLLDRVIALQRVPMLSGLDPEDLDLIAEASEEAHYVAGERIYREGDGASQMIVIIDGEAIVTTGREGATQELARRGPGQHIGELALLHRSERSADVHAGDSGLFALTIADTDLVSILQERPEVAIAMLDTLASRLAE